jgi:V/A-type H+-transporting ATPase subunit K
MELFLTNLGVISAFILGASGSAYGCAIGGMAAVGVWKKAFLNGKTASPLMFVFAGTALSQTIYGFILMLNLRGVVEASGPSYAVALIGIVAGAALALTAVVQAKLACVAADSQGETGKGFAQYLVAIGIVETVALFITFFSTMAL